jgi:hypothetical protein
MIKIPPDAAGGGAFDLHPGRAFSAGKHPDS